MRKSAEWDRVEASDQRAVKMHQRAGEVPIGAIASELGVSVKVASLPTGVSGMIYKEGGHYTIKVNRFEAKERQRFTVAHELAHYLLHRDIIDRSPDGIRDTVLYRSGNPEQIEFEANRLAADILMPREEIDKQLANSGGRVTESAIEALARYFRVSRAAMEIRLGAAAV